MKKGIFGLLMASLISLISLSAYGGELRVTLNSNTKAPAFCDSYSITATGGGKTYTSQSKTLTGSFPSSTTVEVKASASGCKNSSGGSTVRTIKIGQDDVNAKLNIVF